jgi:transposase-like protein
MPSPWTCYMAVGSDPYAAILSRFPTPEAAEDFLAAVRWPADITCPACAGLAVSWKRERARPDRFQCSRCRRSFSVQAGTFLGRTHMDLRVWFRLLQCPEDMPTAAVARLLDVRRPTVARMRGQMRHWALDPVLRDLRSALGPA